MANPFRTLTLQSYLTRFLLLLTALVALAAAPVAYATPLAPGDTIPAVGEAQPPIGAVLVDSLAFAFASATFSGTLTTSVFSGDVTNPWNAVGGLTFVFRLENDVTSQDALGRFTLPGYLGFFTDVSYRTPTLGSQAPSTFDRSITGNVVGFDFSAAPIGVGAILPGDASSLLVIQTDAAFYQPGFAGVIDGTVIGVETFSPVAVPEPSSLPLLSLGLVGIALRRSTRRSLRS